MSVDKSMDKFAEGGTLPIGYHRMPDGEIMADSEHFAKGGNLSNKVVKIDGTIKKITYDDTRDISIRCVDELIDLGVLNEDDDTFEVQDLIQDEINKVLSLDIDDNFSVNIIDGEIMPDSEDFAKGGYVCMSCGEYAKGGKVSSGDVIKIDGKMYKVITKNRKDAKGNPTHELVDYYEEVKTTKRKKRKR